MISNRLKKIILFSLLAFLFLWAVTQEQFTLRLKPADYFSNPRLPGQQAKAFTAKDREIDLPPHGGSEPLLNLQESFAKVAELVKPAVVSIATVQIEKIPEPYHDFYFWEPEDLFDYFFNFPSPPRQRRSPQRRFRQREVPGSGSGVIIDPDGYILTNEHVVRGADKIQVTLADDPDKKIEGKVIGKDERTDLAVIKIKSARKLPYAKLGDSDSLRVGDWAIAIGSPFGLELAQTVTVGVISASRQNVRIEGKLYKDLIQTDAAINKGNSGGPLLNIRGEVIGVNTAIFTPSGAFAGIGFSIPINRAKEILPQLREKGRVIRGWIGVELDKKIDQATAKVFGVPNAEGALIRKVLPDYPAAKAGLQRGDVIVEFAGKKVKNNFDLQNAVAATPPKKNVPVKIIRNKKERTLQITVAEAPASLDFLKEEKKEEKESQQQERGEKFEWLGATVRELSASLRAQLGLGESESGVVIFEVKPNSKAEEIGLMPKDLIRALNQEKVTDLKSFKEIIKKIKLQEGIVLDILRKGEPLYLPYMDSEK